MRGCPRCCRQRPAGGGSIPLPRSPDGCAVAPGEQPRMVGANSAVPRANDDTPLVYLAIQKDQEAFGELYDRHVVRVYRHLYYMLGNSAEAEDLAAQTFLRAWEAIP